MEELTAEDLRWLEVQCVSQICAKTFQAGQVDYPKIRSLLDRAERFAQRREEKEHNDKLDSPR